MSLLGFIQKRSPFKIALHIPRIRLPKLALPALLTFTVPTFTASGFSLLGKISSLAGGLLSSLTPFQQKLSSMFGSISNLSAGSALNFVKGVLTSAVSQITKLAGALIQNAIGCVTAAIGNAINAVSAIEKSIESEINFVKGLFKKQTTNVVSLVQGEINAIGDVKKTITQVSSVQAHITTALTKSTENLTNIQIKNLQENPAYLKTFTANITDNAIASAASRVVAKNSMINNPVMQANTVIQLGLPPVVPTIYVNSLTPNMA